MEITKSYQAAAPGPHVFLVVLDINRFTKEEHEASKAIQRVYDDDAVKYCIIVFTGLDKLEADGITIEQYLSDLKDTAPLNLLLNQYGRRYLAVNNRGSAAEKEKALENLLDGINAMLTKNGTAYYTSATLKAVNASIEELKEAGEFIPVTPDGSIIIYEGPKKIVSGFLRRNAGKSSVKH